MDFGLSQEQTMLQETLARFLKENAGLARTRAFAAAGGTRAPDVLAGLANLGVAGILIDEEHGGVGLSLLDAALAAELLGYHVTAAPFIGSSVLAPLALQRAGSAAQRNTWLPRLAAGTAVRAAALRQAIGRARFRAGQELPGAWRVRRRGVTPVRRLSLRCAVAAARSTTAPCARQLSRRRPAMVRIP